MTTDNKLQHDGKRGDGHERRRTVFFLASEFGLVLGCAGIFVAFLVALIGIYFPIGSELVGDYEEGQLNDIQQASEVIINVDSESSTTEPIFAAEIVKINRRVKRRKADSLAWNTAHTGDEVRHNDAVQTFSRSIALLQVNRRSHLTTGENSLIIFDEQEADPFLQTRQSVLVMMDGELSGTLATDQRTRFQFGVDLPNSNVTLLPEKPGDKVKFLITVNDDKSTTVNLHQGTARIEGLDGQKKTIDSQDSITIDPTGTDMRVSKIPPVPKSVGPSNNSVVKYREIPKQVVFTWAPVGRADRYHIVVARDPGFSDRLVDDDVIGSSFTHGALGPGTYYWHVRSRADLSQSAQSASRMLRVIQDRDAPMLELEPPSDVVSAGNWRLNGRTDEDAAVYVDGIEIVNDNGRINAAVELQPGANVVTVRAVDDVGNLSYASVAVNAK
ncbi:MAG: hypothetical protein ACR2P5_03255 [Gammaproteobacteria bacterium]